MNEKQIYIKEIANKFNIYGNFVKGHEYGMGPY